MATEEEKHKAEELNNSRNLDVHKWSEYPEVNRAVAQIFEEFKNLPEFKGKQNIQKRHIKVIVLDLFVRWLEDPEGYIAFYRGKGMYEGESRYNQLYISFVSVGVIDHLAKLGYLEQHMGFYHRTGSHASRKSRIRATDKLTDLIVKKHGVKPAMIEKHPQTECIILRDADKKDINYEDTENTKRLRKDLYNYNNLLRRTHIDVHSYPKEGAYSRSKGRLVRLDRNDKFIRRIYNNGSWEQGGRYYGGWWQRIPKEWREYIYIDGSPTVEIDYSGLHIILLYGKEGIDYWKDIGTDPYELAKYKHLPEMRGFLKQLLLTIVNAESKTKALQAIRQEINRNKGKYRWLINEGIDIEDLIEDFAKSHQKIKDYFYGGAGIKLQNVDSRIAERIINQLSLETIPVLCVHDSFIVAKEHQDRLMQLMIESFNAELPKTDPKMKNNINPFHGDISFVPSGGSWSILIDADSSDDRTEMDRRLEEHRSKSWSKEYYKQA